MDKLVEDSSTDFHRVARSISVVFGQVYRSSIHAKAVERTEIRLAFDAKIGSGWAFFNLSTGTVGASSGGVTPAIEDVGNGIYRCSITDTATATGAGTAFYQMAVSGSHNYSGDGSSGLYVWGAQLATSDSDYFKVEAANSGIPTLAIAATGERLDIPAYHVNGFDPIGREPVGQYNKSVAGKHLGKTIKYEEWSQAVSYEFVTWAWLRATWLVAWKAHLRGQPFVYVWDRDNHPTEIRLVVIDGGFKGPHRSGQVGILSFSMSAEA
jgi:hypothetical protein